MPRRDLQGTASSTRSAARRPAGQPLVCTPVEPRRLWRVYPGGVYEALNDTDCEQILFMDDVIRIEPDSGLRGRPRITGLSQQS